MWGFYPPTHSVFDHIARLQETGAGLRGVAAALPVTVTKKKDDVEKTASVAFLIPYNCSNFLTLCKLVISATEACTGVDTWAKPPNTN